MLCWVLQFCLSIEIFKITYRVLVDMIPQCRRVDIVFLYKVQARERCYLFVFEFFSDAP
jgi:hypothetical protein